jgi:hypothetical protein
MKHGACHPPARPEVGPGRGILRIPLGIPARPATARHLLPVSIMLETAVRRPGASAALEELWDSVPSSVFLADERPPYVRHAILPETPKASAVRLVMRGEIRLDRWRPFRAVEVIHHRRGFVWKAKVAGGISGADCLVDGDAASRWNLLGLFPVMKATGDDVTKSAIGRWLLESIWLPTMLRPDDGAAWAGNSVSLTRLGLTGRLDLSLTAGGGLKDFRMGRWGNPDDGTFGFHVFGGIVEEEREFDGHVLPSRIRAGWHFGEPGWDRGEFFRATIEEAGFR